MAEKKAIRNKPVLTRLTTQEVSAVKKVANEEGRTMSNTVWMLVREALTQRGAIR